MDNKNILTVDNFKDYELEETDTEIIIKIKKG
jgi:hypothetical protein